MTRETRDAESRDRRDDAKEQRARREAHRIGLVARKSRWQRNSIDNYGGFALFDPSTGAPVYGWRYDLTAEDVIHYCRPETP